MKRRGPDKKPRKSPYRPPPGRRPKNPDVTLTRALRTVRIDTIDKRSQVGCLLRRIREDLLAHLGGPDAVSTTELMLIEQLGVDLRGGMIDQAWRVQNLEHRSSLRRGRARPLLERWLGLVRR